jgi:hypothetical protein
MAEHTGRTITRHTTRAKTPNATKDAGFGDVGAPPAKAGAAATPIHDAAASITMRHRRIGSSFGSIDLTRLRVAGFHRRKTIDCYRRRCGGPREPEP